MAMSIKKLLALAARKPITDDDAKKLKIKKLKKRLAKAEKDFKKKDREKYVFPPGFLDREFTL